MDIFQFYMLMKKTVKAQIAVGVQTYERYFGKNLVAFGYLSVDMSQKQINI